MQNHQVSLQYRCYCCIFGVPYCAEHPEGDMSYWFFLIVPITNQLTGPPWLRSNEVPSISNKLRCYPQQFESFCVFAIKSAYTIKIKRLCHLKKKCLCHKKHRNPVEFHRASAPEPFGTSNPNPTDTNRGAGIFTHLPQRLDPKVGSLKMGYQQSSGLPTW